MSKQELFEALKTDRLYGIDVEKGFKMLCESHDELENALNSGMVIRDANDIWMTNDSPHRTGWSLIVTINTSPYK